jgi:hypothetical protein
MLANCMFKCTLDLVGVDVRPESLDDLDELREQEEFWEVGTHAILDVDRVVPSTAEDHDGTVRQLPTDEALSLFGTAQPTRDQFEALGSDLPLGRSWSGFYQLLHEDGTATEVAFWGVSGH